MFLRRLLFNSTRGEAVSSSLCCMKKEVKEKNLSSYLFAERGDFISVVLFCHVSLPFDRSYSFSSNHAVIIRGKGKRAIVNLNKKCAGVRLSEWLCRGITIFLTDFS